MLPGPGGQSCHWTPSGWSGSLTGYPQAALQALEQGTEEATAEVQLWNSLSRIVCSLCWSCHPCHSLSLPGASPGNAWNKSPLVFTSPALPLSPSFPSPSLFSSSSSLWGSPQGLPPRVTQLPSSSSSLPFPHPEQRRSVPEGPETRKEEGLSRPCRDFGSQPSGTGPTPGESSDSERGQRLLRGEHGAAPGTACSRAFPRSTPEPRRPGPTRGSPSVPQRIPEQIPPPQPHSPLAAAIAASPPGHVTAGTSERRGQSAPPRPQSSALRAHAPPCGWRTAPPGHRTPALFGIIWNCLGWERFLWDHRVQPAPDPRLGPIPEH